ncbi:hypothetical protein Xbed_03044 [Xenorhabdus beddingii]|uniref:Uncharacterized protein n=1 Tax=Xenorhabdus beddingii TaxID=40578 RepID=A0A1Y2SKV6_9GAMM|nr:hypothetical protein Xbed_03044 [Xenorhabdus beddingii]
MKKDKESLYLQELAADPESGLLPRSGGNVSHHNKEQPQ